MISSFPILNEIIFIDEQNGNFSINRDELLTIGSYPINKAPSYSHNLYSTIVFCLEISNACNLRCSYCFNQNKDGTKMSFETATKALDYLFATFSMAQKFFIDVSGAGEPLLCMGLIEQLSRYAKKKSDEIDREVTVSLVCNGTLLSTTIVKRLQEMNILFGVSIDGCKNNHDTHRKDVDGNGTYDLIMKNVSNIKERKYLGCAVTITNDVFDINDAISDLKRFFETISIKPVRSSTSGIDQYSLPMWKNEYDKLEKRLEKEVEKKDFSTLFCLLNGDDYFGKFIFRSFLNSKALTRCDCASGRIAVSVDGQFFPCPALINSEYPLGNLEKGFDSLMAQNIYGCQTERNKCQTCFFRFSCGGECIAENKEPNPVMCEFKKHLILLSMVFEEHCRYLPCESYQKIYDFCLEKKSRLIEDPKFRTFRRNYPGYTFSDARKIYDSMK